MVQKEDSIKKYFHMWWFFSHASVQMIATSRFGVLFFVFAKLFRFLSFLLFLLILNTHTTALATYTPWQIVLFLSTYTFIDTASQLFLRDVYRFRSRVQSGEFDFYLLRPFSPLFRVLFGGTDILDLPLLVLSGILIVIAISLQSPLFLINIMLYVLLLCNGLLIALAIHILILCIGLVSSSVDQVLWLYRDTTLLGRLPIDVYKQPLQGIITFIIPIGIMISFPSQVLLGLLQPFFLVIALFLGSILFMASLLLWRYMLRFYVSASS